MRILSHENIYSYKIINYIHSFTLKFMPSAWFYTKPIKILGKWRIHDVDFGLIVLEIDCSCVWSNLPTLFKALESFFIDLNFVSNRGKTTFSLGTKSSFITIAVPGGSMVLFGQLFIPLFLMVLLLLYPKYTRNVCT